MTMVALSVPAEWRGELSQADRRLPEAAAPAVRARECPHCGVGALHPAAEANLGGEVLLLVCDHPTCGRDVLMPMQRVEGKARAELSAEQRDRMKRLSF